MDKKGNSVTNKGFIVGLIVITSILFFILAFVFIEYKASKKVIKGKKITEVMYITYSNKNNGIDVDKNFVKNDEDGKKEKDISRYFNFNIESKITDNLKVDYEVVVEKDSKCNISDNNLKIYLERENEGTYIKIFDPKSFKALKKKSKLGSPKGTMVLFNGSYSKDAIEKYRLKAWIKEGTEVNDDTKCHISTKIYGKVK